MILLSFLRLEESLSRYTVRKIHNELNNFDEKNLITANTIDGGFRAKYILSIISNAVYMQNNYNALTFLLRYKGIK